MTETPSSEHASAASVEPNKFSVRFAVFSGLGLCFLLAFAMALMGYMFHRLAKNVPPLLPENTALDTVREQQVEPPLNVEKRRQLAELRAAETEILTTYRWIDQDQGVVRIPIDRAMDILAKQGIPAPPLNKEAK